MKAWFKKTTIGRVLRKIRFAIWKHAKIQEQWRRDDPLSYYQYQEGFSRE